MNALLISDKRLKIFTVVVMVFLSFSRKMLGYVLTAASFTPTGWQICGQMTEHQVP
jgi:hypothetical protein